MKVDYNSERKVVTFTATTEEERKDLFTLESTLAREIGRRNYSLKVLSAVEDPSKREADFVEYSVCEENK